MTQEDPKPPEGGTPPAAPEATPGKSMAAIAAITPPGMMRSRGANFSVDAIHRAAFRKRDGEWATEVSTAYASAAFTHYIGVQPVYFVADPALLRDIMIQQDSKWRRLQRAFEDLNLLSQDSFTYRLGVIKELVPLFVVPQKAICVMYVRPGVGGVPARFRSDGLQDNTTAKMRVTANDEALMWREELQSMPPQVRDFLEEQLSQAIAAFYRTDRIYLNQLIAMIETHFTRGDEEWMKSLTQPEAQSIIAYRLLMSWLGKRGTLSTLTKRVARNERPPGPEQLSSRAQFYEALNVLQDGVRAIMAARLPTQIEATTPWNQFITLTVHVDMALRRMELILYLTDALAPKRAFTAPGSMLRLVSAMGESSWDAVARLYVTRAAFQEYTSSYHGRQFSCWLPYQWRGRSTWLSGAQSAMSPGTPGGISARDLKKRIFTNAPIEQGLQVSYYQYYNSNGKEVETGDILAANLRFNVACARTIVTAPFATPMGRVHCLHLNRATVNPIIPMEDVFTLQHVKWPTNPDLEKVAHVGHGTWFDFETRLEYGSDTIAAPFSPAFPSQMW